MAFLRFRSPGYVVGMMLEFALCVSACTATTPKEDLVKWYGDWLASLPQTYEMTYKEFLGRNTDRVPLVMNISNWVDDNYRLGSVENSETNKQYRLIVNPTYGATINAEIGGSPKWSMKEYSPRTDSGFVSLNSGFGATPGLFADFNKIADSPHSIQILEPEQAKNHDLRVVLEFTKQPTSKPRDPRIITMKLSNTYGGMPTEISIQEFGGISTRKVIDGWFLDGGVWCYRNAKTFIRMAATDKDELHSTERWAFEPVSDAKVDRRDECYLRYYGLPEPGESASNKKWRVIVFLIAIVLLLSGYIIIRRRGQVLDRNSVVSGYKLNSFNWLGSEDCEIG